MKPNTNKIAYVDQPCPRCGSKRFIARTWIEKIPNYSGGFTEAKCTQIECSNKACQKEFEEKQAEEADKKEKIRIKKEENDAMRKENALLAAHKARTSDKSRI